MGIVAIRILTSKCLLICRIHGGLNRFKIKAEQGQLLLSL
jgi:hypothetical protein